MAYTRTYPTALVKYDPATNPLRKFKATITAGTTTITNVPAALVTAIGASPLEWYVAIVNGVDNSISGTYRFTGTGATTLTSIQDMGGLAVTWGAATTGTYDMYLFKNTIPSELDGFPEAILFSTAPSGAFQCITAQGQFVSFPVNSFVAGAIYSISIREITNLGSGVGVLLGAAGYNGSGIIL